MASIAFTDPTGAATLTPFGTLPNFQGWTPLPPRVIGPRSTALGTGIDDVFSFRTDYGASFGVAPLAPVQLTVATRLILHLLSGGSCTVTTSDVAARVYTCTLFPGSEPEIELVDALTMDYALRLTLRNSSAAAMLCDYTPP